MNMWITRNTTLNHRINIYIPTNYYINMIGTKTPNQFGGNYFIYGLGKLMNITKINEFCYYNSTYNIYIYNNL